MFASHKSTRKGVTYISHPHFIPRFDSILCLLRLHFLLLNAKYLPVNREHAIDSPHPWITFTLLPSEFHFTPLLHVLVSGKCKRAEWPGKKNRERERGRKKTPKKIVSKLFDAINQINRVKGRDFRALCCAGNGFVWCAWVRVCECGSCVYISISCFLTYFFGRRNICVCVVCPETIQ